MGELFMAASPLGKKKVLLYKDTPEKQSKTSTPILSSQSSFSMELGKVYPCDPSTPSLPSPSSPGLA